MSARIGRVLIIAGSDSGGGAGIQADIKTVTMLGAYASTAITAVTVQDTRGVQAVHRIPLDVIAAQARAVLDDIGADVIKTGMLGDASVVRFVSPFIAKAGVPAVVDPVMIAKGGQSLLTVESVTALRDQLVPLATLLTPNAPEAAALTGLEVVTEDDQRRAGRRLLDLGAQAVLMKGGHLAGDMVTDLLVTPMGETAFRGPRLHTRHTHGTGCTLASACAAGLAQGLGLTEAVTRAHSYVATAIRRAPGFGHGHGPLDHGWPLRSDAGADDLTNLGETP